MEQEAKPTLANQHKIIFYALLESAMRYREGFWREDIEKYKSNIENENSDLMETYNFNQRKKLESWKKNQVIIKMQESEKLNAIIYGAIEKFNSPLSEQAKTAFDNYSTAYGLIAEELATSKNTTELLSICKLYNSGHLDYLFLNKETINNLNKQYENKDNFNDNHGIHVHVPADGLQEKKLEHESEPFDTDSHTSDPTFEH